MKRITKEYTVWKLDPKRVAIEIVFLFGVFSLGRLTYNGIVLLVSWLV